MTDSQPGNSDFSRRRLLRWAGTTGLVGVAGCSSGDTTEKPTTPPTAPLVSEGEWWPMYLHDRSNTQYNRGTTGPTTPVEAAWTFETGGKVSSSPAVVDESVYIGSTDGNLYALDMGTGEDSGGSKQVPQCSHRRLWSMGPST